MLRDLPRRDGCDTCRDDLAAPSLPSDTRMKLNLAVIAISSYTPRYVTTASSP